MKVGEKTSLYIWSLPLWKVKKKNKKQKEKTKKTINGVSIISMRNFEESNKKKREKCIF